MISILAHWSWSWFWNPSGKWYVFVSGFGSDLTELAIIGVIYKRLNCHVSGCYRLGLPTSLGLRTSPVESITQRCPSSE